jgi:hypothetical protein
MAPKSGSVYSAQNQRLTCNLELECSPCSSLIESEDDRANAKLYPCQCTALFVGVLCMLWIVRVRNVRQRWIAAIYGIPHIRFYCKELLGSRALSSIKLLLVTQHSKWPGKVKIHYHR